MATDALDMVTILKCLDQLEKELLGQGRQWGAKNEQQGKIFALYAKYKGLLKKITGLKAKASNSAEVLNKFLTDEKFAPMFSPFGPDEIGVVSILDKMVKWLKGVAKSVGISGQNGRQYPGFEIPEGGAHISRVESGFLAILETKSNDNLWLFLPHLNLDLKCTGLKMVEMAFNIMSGNRTFTPKYAGAQIPKIDFNIKPDVSFLLKADTYDKNGQYWFVSRAFQQFKFRMDETGARVKVATGMGMVKASIFQPVKLVFDCPFYGWWTQKGIEELPMAVFYADYDCWKNPAGRLEDL